MLIQPEPVADVRGSFARTWCQRDFEAHGLNAKLAQCSVSFNALRGTLRGMHFQAAPHAEAKLVRATRGAIYDVALDLRPESDTYLQWFGAELSADNRHMLYIPEGCAHGFQTLTDNAEVFYQISEFFEPTAGRGFRWNDPVFGILWPLTDPIMSDRDRDYPDYVPTRNTKIAR
jgi:dTDP-4-dehydrorhamnose 3,5-epimerase